MRIAVLDLGTNTFNLLIAEFVNNQLKFIVNNREIVKLGSGTLANHRISPQGLAKGLNAIAKFRKQITEYKADHIIALATSGIRSTVNGLTFKQDAEGVLKSSIEIIDGQREAELISKGVMLALPEPQDGLIMDIGGGSVEFILLSEGKLVWSESFDVGVSRLNEQFITKDPLDIEEARKIQHHLSTILTPLFDRVPHRTPLFGASGAFETLMHMCLELNHNPTTLSIPSDKLNTCLTDMQTLPIAERLTYPGMTAFRADMMPVGALLLQTVCANLAIDQIHYVDYAMKEGVVAEYFSLV